MLFVLFLALPIGYTVYLACAAPRCPGSAWAPGRGSEVFVGLDNYRRRARPTASCGPGWLRVLGYGALVLVVMLGLALLFALLLDSARVRLARFSPDLDLPAVRGAGRGRVADVGLPVPAQRSARSAAAILRRRTCSAPSTITYSMANVAVWGGTGFNMLVLYTTLRADPARLLRGRAASTGRSELQIALRIKIPILAPAIILTTVFSIIATIQVFTEPTTLRPLTNTISSTWSPLMKIYRDAFVTGDLYSAAATSIVIAAISLVLSFGFLRVVRDPRLRGGLMAAIRTTAASSTRSGHRARAAPRCSCCSARCTACSR